MYEKISPFLRRKEEIITNNYGTKHEVAIKGKNSLNTERRKKRKYSLKTLRSFLLHNLKFGF